MIRTLVAASVLVLGYAAETFAQSGVTITPGGGTFLRSHGISTYFAPGGGGFQPWTRAGSFGTFAEKYGTTGGTYYGGTYRGDYYYANPSRSLTAGGSSSTGSRTGSYGAGSSGSSSSGSSYGSRLSTYSDRGSSYHLPSGRSHSSGGGSSPYSFHSRGR